ncbi:hypothetical protein MUGA111182_00210 [Mucilaginibacter galii]|uniref:Uncharacterized protein n=1 Tax=Mucilaginibacter galii TaxID=2005073 RepID=A0A917J897_9SPHI|nr:hypothetical protein [Mucilaginibacter galii]GGI49124.1 hypothetical protein GCM10011425_03360 [Mucilaginibacter galii]
MEDQKIISGATEQEIWDTIAADLAAEGELLDYNVIIDQDGRQTELYIDIDLGGGFESGSELTQLSAPLSVNRDFKFAIHDEDFLDTIGKFFGLEDMKMGYPELDDHVVIKTNAPEKVRELFADAEIRTLFTGLEDFDFGIHTHHLEDSDGDQTFLEFNLNRGITDATELRKLYHAFYTVLVGLEK